MKPGPKPKPTKLKLCEGNPGKRKLSKGEPQPAPGAPPCPSWLTAEAKREWARVVPELDRLGLITLVDRAALAGYCQCWARWRAAEAFIEEHGAVCTMRDDKGNVKWTQPVPQVGIATKMLDRMHKFAAEFGFTPSSRTRLSVAEPANSAEELAEILSRPRPKRAAGGALEAKGECDERETA